MIWTLPQRLAALIGVLALALAAGFGAGYHYKGQAEQAQVVKQAVAAVKEAGANIAQSAEKSQQVEASIAQTDNHIDQLAQAARARLQKGILHEQRISDGNNAGYAVGTDHAATTPGSKMVPLPVGPDDCGADRLDLGTVRLLNRARDEGALESTTGDAH